MVAYYFPPLGGAGVQRSAKFAKYLARLGWQIDVISVIPPAFEPLDLTLEPEINHERISVTRVNHREAFRKLDRLPGGWRVRALFQEWLLFPDRMAGWFDPALQAAEAICAQDPNLHVLTTSAPYTAHLIGLELKRKYHTTWTADFRDEWTQNPYLQYPTPLHAAKHKCWEKRVLNGADLVISVTDRITRGLKSLAPDSRAIFETIPNGFDPDDLSGIVPVKHRQFTMTHVGTLNENRAKLVNPVLTTVRQLIMSGRIPAGAVKIRLVGPGTFRQFNPADFDFVEVHNYLPHRQAIEMMAGSDWLILAESNPAAFTGKIFEYLGLKRPILGLVHPQSPAAELICQADAGWVVDPADSEELDRLIELGFDSWESGVGSVRSKDEVIALYNREDQAKRLADLMMRCC
jgi:glycosyltransferase involved in cell wall biosynthesis